MRCPKCHYLSFEPEARCRNCGYDFDLSDGDLLIKADAEGPFEDFDLRAPQPVPAPMTLGPIHAAPEAASERAPVVVTSAPDAAAARPGRAPVARPSRPPSTTTELPLFMRGLQTGESDTDAPLVPLSPVPRAPLSVRRRSVEPGEPGTPLGPVVGSVAPITLHAPVPVAASSSAAEPVRETTHVHSVWAPIATPVAPDVRVAVAETNEAGAGLRMGAAAIDFALLAGINVSVTWLTLKICTLTFGQALSLPIVPMAAFFGLVDVGYLLLFTATSGQTLGKMAVGIRVVASQSTGAAGADEAAESGSVASAATESPLTLKQALIRSLAMVPSIAALGAGFFPALAGHHLAMHDRLAHTRVVRA